MNEKDFWEGYVPEPVKPAQQEPVAWIDMSQWPPIRWRDGMLRKDVDQFDGQGLVLSTSPPAQRTWEEWFKWWRTSEVADSTEAEIDFADFMLIVRAVEFEYGIKENT